MKRVLLTGAAGFLGSHALRHLLINTDWEIVCPVTFRHRGKPARIVTQMQGIEHAEKRVDILRWDMTAPADDILIRMIGDIDFIVNYASESHVDRSIEAPAPFVAHNVAVVLNALELARRIQPQAMVQISTDEVYGPAPAGHNHAEWETAMPSNPYAASKAAQEAIAFSYWRTYGVPLVVTNCMNLIGELQDAEKFIPLTMRRIARGEPVPIHAQYTAKGWRAGSRMYLHARNLADAVLFLLNRGAPAAYADGAARPDRWHIVGEREVFNDEMAQLIAQFMGKHGHIKYVDFHSSRPGHDLRYALDGRKLAEAGWRPPFPLDASLRRTVEWTLEHPHWLQT